MSSQLVISFIAKLHSSSFKFGSLPTTWTRSTNGRRVSARTTTLELLAWSNNRPSASEVTSRKPRRPWSSSIPPGAHNNEMTTGRNCCLNLWLGSPMVWHHRFMAGSVEALFYALKWNEDSQQIQARNWSKWSKLVKNAKYTMYWLYVNCIL